MELKLLKGLYLAQNLTGFNRTFMELKQYNIVICLVIIVCFNRTFMELKLRQQHGCRKPEGF